ncbi:hypothetical protein JX265_002607 [Neoarthrinium moseri]|uniref:Uncharacterized protein n=1 Tax=Neoarthrinium moseri TaxID=1658444 RepID=A0A9P9WV71_9PEZI|nr:hypothetical protein JX265_002607 [Neoarthrinium moseri]
MEVRSLERTGPFKRGVMFTTWKDLGSGNCTNSKEWRSHVQGPKVFDTGHPFFGGSIGHDTRAECDGGATIDGPFYFLEPWGLASKAYFHLKQGKRQAVTLGPKIDPETGLITDTKKPCSDYTWRSDII